MLKITLIASALVALSGSEEKTGCPNVMNISPCTCQIVTPKEKETWVSCSYIPSLLELTSSIKGMEGYKIDKFVLGHSDIGYIPNNLFLHTPLKEIIITDMNLDNIASPKGYAFEGQVDSLESIGIRRCTLNPSPGIKWSQTNNLNSLESLEIFKTNLGDFPAEWFHFTTRSLRFMYLAENEISEIHKNAFSALTRLVALDLSENRIKVLSRSMFPKPAEFLVFFRFNDNEISSLPEDLFSSMTALRRVNFANNMLQTIDERVWEPKFSQLTHLDLHGNDIPCDCSIFWTVDAVKPTFYHGVCKNATDGNTKKLSSVYSWDLTDAIGCTILRRSE